MIRRIHGDVPFLAPGTPAEELQPLYTAHNRYIEAAGYAAVPVILRQELGWLRPASTDPRYLAAKLHWQTHVFMRRHRASL